MISGTSTGPSGAAFLDAMHRSYTGARLGQSLPVPIRLSNSEPSKGSKPPAMGSDRRSLSTPDAIVTAPSAISSRWPASAAGSTCGRSRRRADAPAAPPPRLGAPTSRAMAKWARTFASILLDVGVLAQELLGVLAPLADALAAEREPGAALLDDVRPRRARSTRSPSRDDALRRTGCRTRPRGTAAPSCSSRPSRACGCRSTSSPFLIAPMRRMSRRTDA